MESYERFEINHVLVLLSCDQAARNAGKSQIEKAKIISVVALRNLNPITTSQIKET